jgi:[ribosomal protein S18]-alanine N-acetyltransferase
MRARSVPLKGTLTAMEFGIREMIRAAAEAIVQWRYAEPYSFYDMDAADDLRQFMDGNNWADVHFSDYDERDDVVGFFEFKGEEVELEMGLGLRPDLTGRGLRTQFMAAGLDFARCRYRPTTLSARGRSVQRTRHALLRASRLHANRQPHSAPQRPRRTLRRHGPRRLILCQCVLSPEMRPTIVRGPTLSICSRPRAHVSGYVLR